MQFPIGEESMTPFKNMTPFIRNPWLRSGAALSISTAICAALFSSGPDWAVVRVDVTKALQAIALLFSLAMALSSTLYASLVKGLRNDYVSGVRGLRTLLQDFYNDHCEDENSSVQAVLEHLIEPLLSFNLERWMAHQPVRDAYDRFGLIVQNFGPPPKGVRYKLIRIEDELLELWLLVIRRMTSRLYVDVMRGALILTVGGMIAIALSYLLPNTSTINATITCIDVSLISVAPFELIFLLSHFEQAEKDESEMESWIEGDDDRAKDTEVDTGIHPAD
jgi:hypothetical protein